MKCNIVNIRYNISNTGNKAYCTSLFLSGTSLLFMGSFDFDQILNIDTLMSQNFENGSGSDYGEIVLSALPVQLWIPSMDTLIE